MNLLANRRRLSDHLLAQWGRFQAGEIDAGEMGATIVEAGSHFDELHDRMQDLLLRQVEIVSGWQSLFLSIRHKEPASVSGAEEVTPSPLG